MTILQVIPYFAPAWQYGGPIHVVLQLGKQLQSQGHKVVVATTTANGDQEFSYGLNPRSYDGLEVLYFKRIRVEKAFSFLPYISRTVGFFYSPELRQYLNQHVADFDIVHLHEFFCYPALQAAKICNRKDVPYIVHIHGMLDAYRLRHRKLKKLVYMKLIGKRVLSKAGMLIALSDAELAQLRCQGIDSDVAIIPNGVSVAVPDSPSTGDATQAFDYSGKKVILFLGRIHPTKGLPLLIRALAQVVAEHPNVLLVVAGPDEVDHKKDLANLIEALDLCDHVTFIGLVAGSKKSHLLKRADIFALTSFSEGSSMAILEALAFGTPVLITDKCRMGIVEEYRAGLVTSCEPDEIAEDLATLLSEPGLRATMGANAAKLVDEHFTWNLIMDKTLEAYTRVLKTRHESTVD